MADLFRQHAEYERSTDLGQLNSGSWWVACDIHRCYFDFESFDQRSADARDTHFLHCVTQNAFHPLQLSSILSVLSPRYNVDQPAGGIGRRDALHGRETKPRGLKTSVKSFSEICGQRIILIESIQAY